MTRLKLASALAVAGLVFSSFGSAQVQRTFVASYGNDANTATNCGFTNPCRGFAAAQVVTSSGGEIVALDAAGYGGITITKSITITANPGFYAGISASSGNAVTIATAGVNVVLRGLNINGIGASAGVNMTNGSSLNIENCVISNFASSGVRVATAAMVRVSDSVIRASSDGVFVSSGATLDVYRTKFSANNDAGVWVNGDISATTTIGSVTDSDATGNNVAFTAANVSGVSTGVAKLAVTRSTATHNTYGVYAVQASGTAIAVISNNSMTGNDVGAYNNGATIFSQGNNTMRLNTSDTSGVISAIAGN